MILIALLIERLNILDSVVKEAEARDTCYIFVLLLHMMKLFLRIWLLFLANVSISKMCSRFDNGSYRFLDYTLVSFYGSSSVGLLFPFLVIFLFLQLRCYHILYQQVNIERQYRL